ncbi:BglII/BstYI family type II restriction endonuclease [Rickettsia endosymbiont of Seladonia tumulorum]|uniref:BglII/BstYI family type II restriction endonuclease n=1 Tax=Rickettsia endosymbiont of Seladonia tumulorum TaxID=3066270 RepID=UPI00313C504B
MGKELFPDFIKEHYEIHEWKHAIAILKNDFVDEWSDIIQVLKDFRFKKSWITVGGGEKSEISKSIDKSFAELGWKEKMFLTKVIVDENSLDSPTHKVDCYKNRIALEIEWNNKDPFFDRDLNNFRLLFDLRAISIGIIITRCTELQKIFNSIGKSSSYGASTTHISKLLPRIEGGGGGGCPILVFGITNKLYIED